jgi:hypothetical protein
MIMSNEDNMSGENPGVMIKVDGRLVPCDKYIASMRTNIELALKWKDEESTLLESAYDTVLKLIDELPLESFQQYVEAREDLPGSLAWCEYAERHQSIIYYLMDEMFTIEVLREYLEERKEEGEDK